MILFMIYVVSLNLKGFFINYILYCTLCKDFDWWMTKVLDRTQSMDKPSSWRICTPFRVKTWGSKYYHLVLRLLIDTGFYPSDLPPNVRIVFPSFPLFPLLHPSQFENLFLHSKCQQCGNLVLSFTCALCLCFPLFDVSLSLLTSSTWNAIQWALSNCCSSCCCCCCCCRWQIRTFFISQSGAACTIWISVLEMSACHEDIMQLYAGDLISIS